jgi:hypothetical protein
MSAVIKVFALVPTDPICKPTYMEFGAGDVVTNKVLPVIDPLNVV